MTNADFELHTIDRLTAIESGASVNNDARLFRRRVGWFLSGVKNAFSTAALITVASMFGFGVLAHAADFGLTDTMLMTGLIWALPSQVILVGAVSSGAGLLGAAFAVALSAVRLMPLTVALVPILRGPRTSKLTLYLLSHFVMMSSWVEGVTRVSKMPRDARVAYFTGYCLTFVVLGVSASAVGHGVAGVLPPLFSAALLMLTPAYFAIGLVNASTGVADRVAMALGFIFSPLAALYLPGPDLVWSGLGAGTLAYLIDRSIRKRAKP